jgi:hypothetical protein
MIPSNTLVTVFAVSLIATSYTYLPAAIFEVTGAPRASKITPVSGLLMVTVNSAVAFAE